MTTHHLSERLMKPAGDAGPGAVEMCNKPQQQRATTSSNRDKIASLRIGFVVYRIWEVNDADRTFRMDFRLHATWVCDAVEANNVPDDGGPRSVPLAVPEWNFTNCVEEVQMVDTDPPRTVDGKPVQLPPALRSVPPAADGGGPLSTAQWWTTNVRYRGIFFHCNDGVQRAYQSFPMDLHDFDVVVRVPRVHLQGIGSVGVDPERSDCHTSLAVRDAGLIDFRVLDLTVRVHVNEPKAVNFKPDVILSVVTARRAYYYFTCVYVPLAIIVGMSLTSFLMSGFADRMNLLVTVLLCVVAFKFTVAARLPILPDATQLDRYITFLYVFVVALVLSHAVSHQYFVCDDDDTGACSTFDRVSSWVWSGVCCLAHAYVLGGVVMYEMRMERLCKLVVWRLTEYRDRELAGTV